MEELEGVVTVLTVALALTWAAQRVRASVPLVLLCGGVLVGLLPGVSHPQLPAQGVLLIFLPPLLYSEALTISLHQIRANLRVIVLLAVALVLATMVTVAVTAHAFDLGWAAAFVLGAVVAPTDATAVAAVGDGLPRRMLTIVQAESLVNDGTALAAYAVAVDIADGAHPFSWGATLGRFLLSYAGGIAVGAVVAWLVIAVRRHIDDDRLEAGLSVLTPFAAYLPAELAHASGVLAVVTVGLMISRASPLLIRPRSRVQTLAFWNVTSYLLNRALFVLVGIELPSTVRALTSYRPWRAALLAAAVAGVVMATRLAWSFTTPYLIRLLDRRPQQRARRVGWRQRLPLSWGGVRGGVSVAAALAVPSVRVDGTPLAARDVIVFVAAMVVAATLLVQGQTLPAVIRWSRLPPDTQEEQEQRLALREMAHAGLAALSSLALRYDTPGPVVDRVRTDLRDQIALHEQGAGPDRVVEARLRGGILSAKRTALVALRDGGRIDDGVLRQVQEHLDAEELRLDLRLAGSLAAAPDEEAHDGGGVLGGDDLAGGGLAGERELDVNEVDEDNGPGPGL